MSRPDGARLILDWVRNHSRQVGDAAIDIDTPLIRNGVITSLQLTELILCIEQLRGRPVDVTRLVPGSFHSVATIAAAFLDAAVDERESHGS